MYLSIIFQKPLEIKLELPPSWCVVVTKWLNNEERLRERIKWCQMFLKLNSSMANVVYMDEVGFYLHLARRFERVRWGLRYQWICPTQRGWNLSLVVAAGHERVIAHDVTLGAYNTYKFLEFTQVKVNPNLDRQRCILMDNFSFHKSWNTTSFRRCSTHLHLFAII